MCSQTTAFESGRKSRIKVEAGEPYPLRGWEMGVVAPKPLDEALHLSISPHPAGSTVNW